MVFKAGTLPAGNALGDVMTVANELIEQLNIAKANLIHVEIKEDSEGYIQVYAVIDGVSDWTTCSTLEQLVRWLKGINEDYQIV